MPCVLSMPNAFWVACLGAALAVHAQLGVTPIRQPGAALDVSTRQELNHAVDLATAWLAERQNPDGSWGSETSRTWRTSVALLALTARASQHSDAIARAAVWLDGHPPVEAIPDNDRAWRIIALLSVVSDWPTRTNLASRLFRESQAYVQPTNAPFCRRDVWDDARRLAGIATRPPSSDQLTDHTLRALAANPQALSRRPPYCNWFDIRLINRVGNGALLRDGVALDWRRDVAQSLINAQRRDPSGGYWQGHGDDELILATAFGILNLQEL